jgi:lauroyl/myristoyl acyltransferase
MSMAAIQSRFPRSVARVQRWHAIVNDTTPITQVVIQHLMANTWLQWRREALLSNRSAFARWVTVDGEDAIGAMEQSTTGVIVVSPHTNLAHMVRGIPALRGRETLLIPVTEGASPEERADINHPQRMAQRAALLLDAHRVLAGNGVVWIMGDGPAGVGGVTATIGNRRLEFRVGAAQLSLSSGACMIPVFTTMQTSGAITLHLDSPIEPAGLWTDDRAATLTAEYAERFARNWHRQYATMLWGYLARFLGQPIAQNLSRRTNP